MGGEDRPQSKLSAHVEKPVVSESAPWYTKKLYVHFDVALNEQRAVKLATNPDSVKKYPFYPLITYTQLVPRIRKSPEGSSKSFTKEPKERRIAYPAHKDGYIFSYYKSILEEFYERWLISNRLQEAVTAFRPSGKTNILLAKEAFDFIKTNPGCRIVATDVESFFDNLDHRLLKETWACFLKTAQLSDDHFAVFKAITRFSVVERHRLYNLFGIRTSGRLKREQQPERICTIKQFREKVVARKLIEPNPGLSRGIGIPQGSQISPLLSNMYMAIADLAMNRSISAMGGKYWRYCDDILMVLPEDCSKDVLEELDSWLSDLQLARSLKKTQELSSEELSPQKQLQYLGFLFDGSDVFLRSSSIQRYYRKTRKAMRAAMVRRKLECCASGQSAPFRKQALYNMYSDLPIRGKKIRERKASQKYKGNFIDYMNRSAAAMNSDGIRRQKARVLRRLRSRIRKHAQLRKIPRG